MQDAFSIVLLSADSIRGSPRHAAWSAAIDSLGIESARAQGLAAPITSYSLLQSSPPGEALVVYLACLGGNVARPIGLLKTGVRTLFVHTPRGALWREVTPAACVLDFFVHPAHRRRGVGAALFREVLAVEGRRRALPAGSPLPASQLAFDRPSAAFLAFLRTIAGLRSFAPQANNFVLFDEFFDDAAGAAAAERRAGGCSPPRSGARASPAESSPSSAARREAARRWELEGRSSTAGASLVQAHFRSSHDCSPDRSASPKRAAAAHAPSASASPARAAALANDSCERAASAASPGRVADASSATPDRGCAGGGGHAAPPAARSALRGTGAAAAPFATSFNS